MRRIEESELILNSDDSIFHLHLKKEQISDKIILVGDPGRVKIVSSYFDSIIHEVENREFLTHTGYYKNQLITVISTGIGTDNIDIVVNELDALVNIDFKTRTVNKEHKTLNFVRIGTSGALQKDIDVDSFLVSEIAIGFDGMLNFYSKRDSVSDLEFENNFKKFVNWNKNLASPYIVKASDNLVNTIGKGLKKGVTISAPGFYGPQGRQLRLETTDPNLNDKISSYNFKNYKITNYEMESSAIFGLSKIMGHNALTICAIIANRMKKEYSKDYHPVIKDLIKLVLDRYIQL